MIVVPHHVSALYVGVCGLGLALACGAGVSREEPNSGVLEYGIYPRLPCELRYSARWR